MDAGQPLVVVGYLADPLQALQQIGELRLALMGEQEVVKCLEAPTLIGFGDAVTAAERLVEEGTLRPAPSGDLLTQVTVEAPEVFLHPAEVRQQLGCAHAGL